EELTRLNGELTQFTYSASHDLKAPLTTLDGLLGCLAEDAAAGAMDEVLLNADRAQVLARRLAGLLESTLGLVQSESLASDAERIDLAEMVDEVGQALEGALSAYDVELYNEIPIGCELVVQSIRLRQILENLISNAAKYSDCSKNGSFVRISIERDLDCHKITVADNGVGIPEQSHADVFKRFRRFGDQSIDGTGVGLALVEQHVVRMKGEITFESSPKGTVFVVALPRAIGIWSESSPSL
ncbi:MAG: HAMP domain-containing histidine kinase, partial [bacterium]|nr:HAMP domain-containing histidine kinase [bacterium]